MTKHLVKKFQAIQSYVLDTHLNMLSEYCSDWEMLSEYYSDGECKSLLMVPGFQTGAKVMYSHSL